MGLSRLFGIVRARPRTPRVALMGALRSGTNYLKFLLESNYLVRAEFGVFGWKHGGVPILTPSRVMAYPDLPLFYVVKNPFAFARSLYRYHGLRREKGHAISLVAADAWEKFLTGPIEIFDSQLKSSPRMRFPNPIQYWNFLYWNLETLDRRRFRVYGLNYESLVADPETLREIEAIAPLVRRHDMILTPRNDLERLGNTPDARYSDGQTVQGFDASYYTEGRYLTGFSDAQRSFVLEEADAWIMERRGYDRG